MITDIKFGKISDPKMKKVDLYVYQNLSGNAMINTKHDGNFLGIQFEIGAILSHETLHKVIFKLEGSKASRSLDKWCKSRKWIFNDDSGICFFADELEAPD